MSVYSIANYTITNPETYMKYVKSVGQTVAAYGGKTLVADHELQVLEGTPREVLVVVEFPSESVLKQWYESDAYQAVIGFRKESTQGWVTMARAFTPMLPGGEHENK